MWIGKTVLLETAWVLRSLYGFSEAEIVTALAGLCALENVETEDHRAVLRALDLARKGLALDDSLHLCSAPPDAVFTSFDSKLVKRVRRAGVTRVEAV